MKSRTLTVLTALALSAAACSSSGDEASSDSIRTSDTVSDATTDTVFDATSDTAPDATTDTAPDATTDTAPDTVEEVASAGSGDVVTSESITTESFEGDADSDFCEQVRALDSGETEDPETAEDAIAIFDDLIDAAPDEVVDDLEVVRDAFDEIGDLDPEDPENFERLTEVFSRPDVNDASESFVGYGEDVCGIEPAETLPPVSAPSISPATAPTPTDG